MFIYIYITILYRICSDCSCYCVKATSLRLWKITENLYWSLRSATGIIHESQIVEDDDWLYMLVDDSKIKDVYSVLLDDS